MLVKHFLSSIQTNLEITGNLEISLAYELPGTLKVTLHKGNNLTNHYEEGLPNPFVKIQIPGLNAVYETQVGNLKRIVAPISLRPTVKTAGNPKI